MRKKIWFRKYGIGYIPITWQGIFITAFAIAFMIHTMVLVSRNMYSRSGTMYDIFPFWVPTILSWLWIAERTSEIENVEEGVENSEDNEEDNNSDPKSISRI
jgi:hypothetical protein